MSDQKKPVLSACPLLCSGSLRFTPTTGVWICDVCKATLLVGTQTRIVHTKPDERGVG